MISNKPTPATRALIAFIKGDLQSLRKIFDSVEATTTNLTVREQMVASAMALVLAGVETGVTNIRELYSLVRLTAGVVGEFAEFQAAAAEAEAAQRAEAVTEPLFLQEPPTNTRKQ